MASRFGILMPFVSAYGTLPQPIKWIKEDIAAPMSALTLAFSAVPCQNRQAKLRARPEAP